MVVADPRNEELREARKGVVGLDAECCFLEAAGVAGDVVADRPPIAALLVGGDMGGDDRLPLSGLESMDARFSSSAPRILAITPPGDRIKLRAAARLPPITAAGCMCCELLRMPFRSLSATALGIGKIEIRKLAALRHSTTNSPSKDPGSART